MTTSRGSSQGFTLIEVLIATIILAGAMIVLTNSWGGSIFVLRKAQVVNTVAYLLKRKMTELELKYEGAPLDEVKESEEGDFGADFPEYGWKMKSKKMEFPDLSGVLTAREGGVDEKLLTIIRSMTKQFNQNIKEVEVTVVYKKSKRTLEYKLTTYIIDYSKPLNLLGGG
ncbi:MAG: prepilin-type N-terminal cleavage/methylation domain-containing protein [Bdellovibrionales bacterium]|nr:prepilin-type N-terminal cleavage/methylation domain-containing protein [Bdellovibrionales bacterium]